MAKSHFAVFRGHKPGVYTSLREAQLQCKGYPCPAFKGYNSLEDAKQAIRSYNQTIPTPRELTSHSAI